MQQCRVETIRSKDDAVQDNNLDNLSVCPWRWSRVRSTRPTAERVGREEQNRAALHNHPPLLEQADMLDVSHSPTPAMVCARARRLHERDLVA